MDSVNLVVMGKTGADKSTLINSILGEDLAPTGRGQSVTHENCVYSREMLFPLEKSAPQTEEPRLIRKKLNLYDTVGLEIDASITRKTLGEIKQIIRKVQIDRKANDFTMVWFCVNHRSSRFEPYEWDLIRSLSIEYEIPFILVLTKCLTNEQSEFEKNIKNDLPEIPIQRVLAKDYSMRDGALVSAFGVPELLQHSVLDYNSCKIKVLESKLAKLNIDRQARISQLNAEGSRCIKAYAEKAKCIGYFPVASIPFIYGICVSMIQKLNHSVGISASKEFAIEIWSSAIVGLMMIPLMIIPFRGASIAHSYITAVGEYYLDALLSAVQKSTDEELKNNMLMAERIKAEIKKRKMEV